MLEYIKEDVEQIKDLMEYIKNNVECIRHFVEHIKHWLTSDKKTPKRRIYQQHFVIV